MEHTSHTEGLNSLLRYTVPSASLLSRFEKLFTHIWSGQRYQRFFRHMSNEEQSKRPDQGQIDRIRQYMKHRRKNSKEMSDNGSCIHRRLGNEDCRDFWCRLIPGVCCGWERVDPIIPTDLELYPHLDLSLSGFELMQISYNGIYGDIHRADETVGME